MESLQNKKQEFVRHEIWNAAVDLFLANGYDAVTIEQIAASAGVSRRTFFRYFSSKDDLMGASVKAYGKALCDALEGISTDVRAYKAARRAVAQVLERQSSVTQAERYMRIARQSPAALSAQSLQLPVVEAQLALAFAARAERTQPLLDDRIAASLTFAATKLCVEMWVGAQDRPVREIVEEVFKKLSAISRA